MYEWQTAETSIMTAFNELDYLSGAVNDTVGLWKISASVVKSNCLNIPKTIIPIKFMKATVLLILYSMIVWLDSQPFTISLIGDRFHNSHS